MVTPSERRLDTSLAEARYALAQLTLQDDFANHEEHEAARQVIWLQDQQDAATSSVPMMERLRNRLFTAEAERHDHYQRELSRSRSEAEESPVSCFVPAGVSAVPKKGFDATEERGGYEPFPGVPSVSSEHLSERVIMPLPSHESPVDAFHTLPAAVYAQPCPAKPATAATVLADQRPAESEEEDRGRSIFTATPSSAVPSVSPFSPSDFLAFKPPFATASALALGSPTSPRSLSGAVSAPLQHDATPLQPVVEDLDSSSEVSDLDAPPSAKSPKAPLSARKASPPALSAAQPAAAVCLPIFQRLQQAQQGMTGVK